MTVDRRERFGSRQSKRCIQYSRLIAVDGCGDLRLNLRLCSRLAHAHSALMLLLACMCRGGGGQRGNQGSGGQKRALDQQVGDGCAVGAASILPGLVLACTA